MKIGFTVMILFLGLIAPAWAGEDTGALFDQTCGACHFRYRDPSKRDEMVAPPMDMMSAHLRALTGNDRAAFVARVTEYIKAPDPAKTADAMAVQRFGLMPAIGETFPDLDDGQLQALAGWIFDQFAKAQLPPADQRGRMRP